MGSGEHFCLFAFCFSCHFLCHFEFLPSPEHISLSPFPSVRLYKAPEICWPTLHRWNMAYAFLAPQTVKVKGGHTIYEKIEHITKAVRVLISTCLFCNILLL